jgi:membrane protease YdiL (CAAX protease family)
MDSLPKPEELAKPARLSRPGELPKPERLSRLALFALYAAPAGLWAVGSSLGHVWEREGWLVSGERSLLRALVLLVPAALWARHRLGERLHEAFGLGAPLRRGIRRALLVSALYLGTVSAISVSQGQPLIGALAPWALLYLPLDAAVEEAFFRGFLLLHWARGRRFAAANSLCSLFFVLVHFRIFVGLWSSGARFELIPIALSLFLLALALGDATRATRSIWIAVLLHTLNNILASGG